MNKAFIREPDEVASHCPKCESIGQPVGPQTLNAQLVPETRRVLAESAYFCPDGYCNVVYFDDFSGIVDRSAFSHLIPIKDAEASICSCFGTKREDIETDIAEGTVTRTRAAVEKAQSDAARCSTLAPNGRSCIAEIQGYYTRCKRQGQK